MLTPDATSAAAMNPRMTGSGTESETFFAVAYDAAIAETPRTAATRRRTFRSVTPVAPFPLEPLEPAETLLSSTQDGLRRRRRACFSLRDRLERGAA